MLPASSRGMCEHHPFPGVSWADHSHCNPYPGSVPQFPPLQEAVGALTSVPSRVIHAAPPFLPPSGHVFNMPHDNVKACEEVFGQLKTNHMMSPTLIQIDRANPWSACSAAIITDFLDSGHGEPSCAPHPLTCVPAPMGAGSIPGAGYRERLMGCRATLLTWFAERGEGNGEFGGVSAPDELCWWWDVPSSEAALRLLYPASPRDGVPWVWDAADLEGIPGVPPHPHWWCAAGIALPKFPAAIPHLPAAMVSLPTLVHTTSPRTL